MQVSVPCSQRYIPELELMNLFFSFSSTTILKLVISDTLRNYELDICESLKRAIWDAVFLRNLKTYPKGKRKGLILTEQRLSHCVKKIYTWYLN